MKNRALLLILIVLMVFGVRYILLNTNSLKANEQPIATPLEKTTEPLPEKKERPANSKENDQAYLVTSEGQECVQIKKRFENVENVRAKEKTSNRFTNLHVQIGKDIFRLRKFYKESENSEFLRYLVYKEDVEGNPIIIESSDHRPGKRYIELAKEKDHIIYTESAEQTDSGLFLHYENDKLERVVGEFENNNVNCEY